MSTRAQWAVAAVLGVYAAVSLTTGARHALAPGQSQDLAPVYMAARLWLKGEDPYREHTAADWQFASRRGEMPTDAIDRAYSTPYAPMAVLVVAGIAWLDWETAKSAWLAINLGLAIGIAALLYALWLRGLRAPVAVSALAVWFGGIGLRVGLGNGQHALLWFAAILSMYWLMIRGRSWWAGVPLAISLHKYPLTAVVVPFLAAHGWIRLLAAAALATGLAAGIFVLGLGVPIAQALDSFLVESAWWYGQTGERSLVSQGLTDFRPVLRALLPNAAADVTMYALIGLGLAAVCWPVAEGRHVPRLIDLQALFLFMLVATYHRVYDTIVLILPLCGLALWAQGSAGAGRWTARALAAVLALAWYADPSAIYRRIAPMALDAPPDAGLFLALDLGYRLVVFCAFIAILFIRFAPPEPTRLVVAEEAWS